MKRNLDTRIGWYDERDADGRFAGGEKISGNSKPWWLPMDLRLTKRGEAAVIMLQVFVLLALLLLGLAFVGGIEQGTL